ncbi:MAG: hypothetical protein M3Z30_03055 [Gemmatimonadota bacterium]|nr:hypothetical protein [Gemmatimonadota bacterium]
MTTTDTEAMSALHQLLDERLRYQGWLSTLESRRSSTPPHVYERVQTDYSSRLDRVMQSLAERAGQLSGTIESMLSELSSLRQHEADRTDERHESELRAAVGEFTPEDWEARRAEADSDLEKIAAERHALESELEELQRIIGLTGSISASPDFMDGDPAASGGAGIHVAPANSGADSDDSAPSIEQFVAEWNPPRVAHGSAASDTRDASTAPIDTSDLDGMIIPAAPMGANPIGAAGADYGMANGVAGAAGGIAPTRAPAALGDSKRDADKTLKCPECGTMNYATEWYCERCGGELSTF